MTIFLSFLVIVLLALVIFFAFEITSIEKQLKYINTQEKTNKRITTSFQSKKWNKLVREINRLIDKHSEKERELGYEKERIKNQITSISHDLRTPLTSIIGYLDLLEKSKDDEEFSSYLDIVRKKAASLQKLVVDFYEISLLEDKKYELDLEKVAPYYLLEDAVMEYYKDLEKAGIKTEIRIESSEETCSNSKALSRVYSNLLSNIKKHGEKEAYIFHGLEGDKLVTIFKNKIKAGEEVEESKLFEKFYTGEKSRHENNSGIGMYSSKVLIEKMKHIISAKIDEGYLTIKITY